MAPARAGLPRRLREQLDQGPTSPYPRWRRLREEDPVHWHERVGAWLVTRYADAVAALRDKRLGSGTLDKMFEPLGAPQRQQVEPMRRSLGHWLLYKDREEHTRVRSLLARDFSPRGVARLRALVEQEVELLLGAVEPGRGLELMGALAVPLPVRIIARLLGVPVEESSRLKQWVDELAQVVGRHRAGPEHAEEAWRGWQRLTERFRALVEARRREPGGEDVLELLVGAERQGRLSEEEVLATCAALLFAGSETTTYLLGNAVLALLAWPEQRERLAAEPGLLGSAVEEFLRYDAPTQAAGRVVLEDLELGGRTLRRGESVIILLGAANRDPARFEEPDTLRLERKDNAHLAFGLGPHFCLGAPLARLEAEVALGALLRRFEHLSLGEEHLEWVPNPTLRGLVRLSLVPLAR